MPLPTDGDAPGTVFRIDRQGVRYDVAYLNQLLHRFLVSMSERFRLRVYILGRSFALATTFLMHSTQRIVRNEPEADREWQQIDAIRHDFQTLTEESLTSLRALLTSLAAERHEDLIDRL